MTSLYEYQVIYNPISDWVDATNYFVGNKVFNNSSYYQCILDHLSDNTNDPGTGASWTDFWVLITPTSPNTDITRFVETIKDIEIGSGQVRSLSLRLNANDGAFITFPNNNGETPIIDQFDKISLSTTDRRGETSFAVYEVDTIHPTLDGAVGIVLPVDLIGSEFYLQKTLFADQFFFKSMFDVSSGIVDFYNNNRGSEQVQIIDSDANSSNGGFNDLPKWTANDYTFNLSEKSHYDGLLEVIDRGGSSVAAGGAGDFFELAFENNQTNVDQINFRGFSSGFPSDQTSIPIISNTISVNPAEQEGEIQATPGTVTGTWSDSSIGFLPRQNADFIGGLEAWRLFPQYVSGETYPEDAIILVVNTTDSQSDNFHYKANKETTLAPPVPPTASNADWDQYFFTDFLTNEIVVAGQYSRWTNARNNEWKSNIANSGGDFNWVDPDFDSPAVWDSNQVINDDVFNRTWADTRAINFDGIPAKFKRNGGVYRGFRVLVDGTGTDEFVGFDDDVIQWSGTQWLIFKEPATDEMVAVDDEGRVYQFDTDTANAWADISGSLDQGNECYHPVWAIYNSQGQNNKNNGAGGNFGEFSAVTHEFRYEKTDSLQPFFNESKYYRMFAGVDFRVPFPFNSDNGNVIGELYGDNDSLLPATFEAENMGLTSSGLEGFNNTESEDLGPFKALTFFIKHEWRHAIDGSGGLIQAGNYSYRCALYDIDDTVVIHDFVIPFNNLWTSIELPINGFQTYKARAPWAFGNAGQNIFLQEIEILNSFRWRNIKKIAIHWLGPYDDQGRYYPPFQLNFIVPSLFDAFNQILTNGEFNVKLSIDSFQWAKPGLSVSPPNDERPLQPMFFFEPQLTNKYQLDQANLAKLEITKFRHKGYNITTVGLNDLKYGDSFFLENSKLVNDEDLTTDDMDQWASATNYIEKDYVQNSGTGYICVKDNLSDNNNEPGFGANWPEFWNSVSNPVAFTIKLVAKKIERLIDKVPTGPGGYLRTITGVRRFTEGEE